MADGKETLRERLRARLAATGKSPHAVSMEIGANRGYVRDLLDPTKTGMPSGDRLRRLAESLDTTTDYLIGEADSSGPVRSEVRLSDRALNWKGPVPGEPGIPLVGTGDCSDLIAFETNSGKRVHVERFSFDPDFQVRMIARPPALRGMRDLYAIYYQGSSMEPRFEAGEVGIVDPSRPARIGDYVVAQLREEGGDDVVSVIVKRLVGQAAKEYTFQQFNPPLTFSIDRAQVKRLHRIVPQTDLLFG